MSESLFRRLRAIELTRPQQHTGGVVFGTLLEVRTCPELVAQRTGRGGGVMVMR